MDTPFGSIPDRFVADMSVADAHEYLQQQRRRRSRRRFLQGSLAVAGLAAVSPTLLVRRANAALPPMPPRLALGNDPARTMNITWSTYGDVTHPRLEYGLDAPSGTIAEAETRKLAGLPRVDTSYHHVRLTGLEPGTTYRFRLTHDGADAAPGEGAAEELTFTTATGTAQPFTFTAFGDQGTSPEAAVLAEQVATAAADVHLVAGDLCYANDLGSAFWLIDAVGGSFDPWTWDHWYHQNRASMARTPWMPALGNHDIEPGIGVHGYGHHDSRMSLPTDGFNSYVYTFRYGNVAFVALDANDVSVELPHPYTDGAQTAWLDRTLAALRADPTVDFIVAYFHHCAYCTLDSHGSDGGVRDQWVPLFDRHGVDLVLNGHNHGYERTTPIRAGVPTVEAPVGATVRSDQVGTTYLCVGGGGKALHDFAPAFVSRMPLAPMLGLGEPEDSPWSVARHATFCFLKGTVTPPDAHGTTSMALTTIDWLGVEIDSVTLTRQVRAAAAEPDPAVIGLTPSAPAEADPAPAAAGDPATRAAGATPAAITDRELARTGAGNTALVATAAAAAALAASTAARRTRTEPEAGFDPQT